MGPSGKPSGWDQRNSPQGPDQNGRQAGRAWGRRRRREERMVTPQFSDTVSRKSNKGTLANCPLDDCSSLIKWHLLKSFLEE